MRYADFNKGTLRAARRMVDIAEHPTEGYVQLREIAQRQEISEKYLETIIKTLVRAKLLSGIRGKGGGYKLNRAPEQYTVGEVLRLTEESLAPSPAWRKTPDHAPELLTA